MKKKTFLTAAAVIVLSVFTAACSLSDLPIPGIGTDGQTDSTDKDNNGGDDTVKRFKSPLTEYRYSRGGGMEGGHTSKALYRQDDGTVLYVYEDADYWYSIPYVCEYILDPAVMDEIEDVFYEYNIKKYPNKPDSHIEMLDGDTTHYTFEFGDKTISYAPMDKKLPKDAGEAHSKINDIIKEYVSKGELLPNVIYNTEPYGGISEDDLEYNFPETGTVFPEALYYERGYLYYRLVNGTGEEVEYFKNILIENEATGEDIYCQESEYPVTVNPNNHTNEESLHIPERPAPGRYKIVVGDYESYFDFGFDE